MTTKDLVGDPLSPTPAMTDPIPWRVFYVNDMEWWVARSLDELKAAYIESTGVDDFDETYEVEEKALDELRVALTDEDDNPSGESQTFRQLLAERVACGLSAPEFFAGYE